jgi:hypothetical protein
MTAGVPSAAAGRPPAEQTAAAQQTGMNKYTDAQLQQIAVLDPDNRAMIEKFIEDRRKAAELALKTREVESKEAVQEKYLPGFGDLKAPKSFWDGLAATKNFEEMDAYLKKNYIELNTIDLPGGGKRVMNKDEIEAIKEEKKALLSEKQEAFRIPELGGKTYMLKPSEVRALEKAREKGPEAVEAWKDKIQGKTSAKAQSVSEQEAEAAGSKAREQELAKAAVEKITAIREAATTGPDIVNNATAMITFATDPKTKGAFGQFTKPGIISAIGTLVREGFSAGEYKIGLSAIEEAKLKLTGTQEEIDAANAAAATLANFELAFRRAFLKGQGAVSNTESQTVSRLAGSISDSPKTLEYKAKLLNARGIYDQEFGRKFEDLLDKDPTMTVEKAKRLTEFINLKANYDKHLVKLQKSFIGSGRPASAPSGSISDRIFGG